MASYSYHLGPNESWGKGSVEIGPPAEPGQSRIRRLEKTHDRLVTAPMEGINTVHDVLLYASRTHGTRKAFGYRDVLDVIEEQKEVTKTVGGREVKETKTWKYFHLSDYKYINFLELKNIVSEVSRGLLKLGVQKNDVFNIYAQTGYVAPAPLLSSLVLHPPYFLLSFHPFSCLFPCYAAQPPLTSNERNGPFWLSKRAVGQCTRAQGGCLVRSSPDFFPQSPVPPPPRLRPVTLFALLPRLAVFVPGWARCTGERERCSSYLPAPVRAVSARQWACRTSRGCDGPRFGAGDRLVGGPHQPYKSIIDMMYLRGLGPMFWHCASVFIPYLLTLIPV